MRNIGDILHFRTDIPPFLVHLTRDYGGVNARDNLMSILDQQRLVPGDKPTSQVSVVRFGGYTSDMSIEELLGFFGAVCFTETPLNEIHCLLDIEGRNIELQPYGVVFLKEPLQQRGVSPVLYLNNEMNDQTSVVSSLFEMVENAPIVAQRLLPLVSAFGNRIQPVTAHTPQRGRTDFIWEREWRYPYIRGPLCFEQSDIFVGLCPHDEIDFFENAFPDIGFVDARRNMKWYATKLIDARQRLDIKYSVV